MTRLIFLDETKARGLIVVTASMEEAAMPTARRALRELLLRGQRSVHFKKESDSRWWQILSTVCGLDMEVRIYDARSIRDPHDGRAAALRAVVEDAALAGVCKVVLDRDESLLASDRRVLFASVRKAGVEESLTYEHQQRHQEPGLWVPDALAWCYDKSAGGWRERIRPVLGEVRKLS